MLTQFASYKCCILLKFKKRKKISSVANSLQFYSFMPTPKDALRHFVLLYERENGREK